MNAEASGPVRFEAVIPQFTVPDVVHTAEAAAPAWRPSPHQFLGSSDATRFKCSSIEPMVPRLALAEPQGPMMLTSVSAAWKPWLRSCVRGEPRSSMGRRSGIMVSASLSLETSTD